MGVSPDITTPIVRDGYGQTVTGVQDGLGPLLGLVGSWNNLGALTDNSAQNGYNVMPLPQSNSPEQGNVVLRDFHYYEEMTFSAIPGDAANRGGSFQQNCWVLFYEQRVYFGYDAAPQAQNTLVHAENGDWLHLVNAPQKEGPAEGGSTEPTPGGIPVPPYPIVKQVSVPHGNSILATGVKPNTGTGNPTFPISENNTMPANATQAIKDYYNKTAETQPLLLEPVQILQDYVTANNTGDKAITSWTEFTFKTSNPGGAVTNIIFENKFAKVTGYTTTYWLETLADNSTQLQYFQNIEMEFGNNPGVTFYHVDANTMQFVNS